jgi:hypothetical protein
MAKLARLLHNAKLQRFASDKHSNLLGLFVSYEENKVFWKWTKVPERDNDTK